MTPTNPLALLNDGWLWIDSQLRAAMSPLTWVHPKRDALDKLKPGDFVKAGVMNPTTNRSERFWLCVEHVDGVVVLAKVSNDLVYQPQHGLDDGMVVELNKYVHVWGVM